MYQLGKWISSTYHSLAALVIVLEFAMYWQIPEAQNRVPSLFFFSMGGGFLLIETQPAYIVWRV